jgi:hypothetical protein
MEVISHQVGSIGLTLVLLLVMLKEQKMFANLILQIVSTIMAKEMFHLTCAQLTLNHQLQHVAINVKQDILFHTITIYTLEQALILFPLILHQFKLKL